MEIFIELDAKGNKRPNIGAGLAIAIITPDDSRRMFLLNFIHRNDEVHIKIRDGSKGPIFRLFFRFVTHDAYVVPSLVFSGFFAVDFVVIDSCCKFNKNVRRFIPFNGRKSNGEGICPPVLFFKCNLMLCRSSAKLTLDFKRISIEIQNIA